MTNDNSNEKFMEIALKEARKAYKKGEVPIGAVIVKNGKVISKAHNLREKSKNATHHAEILAIEKACKKLKNWRLLDCEIYVTIEPCLMCLGAMYNSRIKKLYFGGKNKSMDGVSFDSSKPILNHYLEICPGIKEEECTKLMSTFFKK